MQKNVAGQTWLAYAFNRLTGEPIVGDAAQITGYVRIDSGSAAALATPNPSEVGLGYYEFQLTQGETNGDVLDLLCASSSTNVQAVAVETREFTSVDATLTATSLDTVADGVSAALANIQLSVQSQITHLGSLDLNVIQGDDYTRGGTRIDLDTSSLPDPDIDLSSYKFIIAAINGTTKIAVRMDIAGDPGAHYCLFQPPSSLTETWVIARYNLLYRIEWATDEFETLNGTGVLTVAPFDIEPADIVDV